MKYSIFFLFLLVLSINSQVTQQWAARYNGSANAYDRANAMTIDGSGNVYVTGPASGNGSNWDYITVKYNSLGTQQWEARYNGPANYVDQPYSIAVDNAGNVYVTGGSFGTGTERDYCTIKYNSNGDSLWVRRFNGPGNDIDEAISVLVDAAGNVYVTGYSDGGVNLDYQTIKYNSAGVQQWASRYDFPAGGTGSEDRPHFMATDAGGNVYVTGESSTGVGSLDMYATVKYNSSGIQQWAARYKGSASDSGLSQAYALVVDQGGNIYVTGRSDPSSPFGFNFDILTIKYNSSGDSVWVKRFNGQGNSSDVGNAIALDGAGNVLVTGLSVINSTADYFTIKYSTSGDQLWTAAYNGPANGVDVAYSIAVDASNNAYVTGYSTGSGSGNDYATVKYNSAGVQQWVQSYNGPGNSTDQAIAVAVDGAGNIYVSGGSIGSVSGNDFATIKYSQLIGIHQVSSEVPQKFSLEQNYPNPFNPMTKIKFSLSKTSNVNVTVFDVLGRHIATLVNQKLNAGTYQTDWDAANMPGGVYFYKIETDDFTETKKMMLIK